jgi:hypothetical protein
MRKYLLAASIGALLLAGQAAASDGAVLNLRDRIAVDADPGASQFQGMNNDLLFMLLFDAAVGALFGWALTHNHGSPASP